MNFKKFISGVSALAIAASAFAGIAVTANAEATVYDFDNTSLTFESSDKGSNTVYDVITADSTGVGSAMHTEAGNKVLKLGSNASGSNKYLGYRASLVDSALAGQVTLEFDFQPNQIATSGNSSVTIQFADDEDATLLTVELGTRGTRYVKVNSNSNFTPADWDTAYKLVANFDFDNRTADIYLKDYSGTTTLASYENQAITAKNVKYLYFPKTSWKYGYVAIDNLSVEQTSGSAKTEDTYTLSYEENGTVITTESKTGYVGDAPDSLTVGSYITYNDTRYIVDSDDAGSRTIVAGGSTVVTVQVHTANTFTPTITCSSTEAAVDGTTVVTGALTTEGDSIEVFHNRYIVDSNNIAYKSTIPTSGGAGYGHTLSYTTQTTAVTYNKFAENVVYFSEGEDISGWTLADDAARMSGGKGGSGTTTINLDAGFYTVYAPTRNGSVNVANGETTILTGSNAGAWAEYTANFTLNEAAALTVTGNKMDYILIVKTGDVAVASVPQIVGTSTTASGDSARGYTFTVTPNDETITSVTVTDANDSTKTVTKDGLNLSGSGAVTFGILVVAADPDDLDKTFTVELN